MNGTVQKIDTATTLHPADPLVGYIERAARGLGLTPRDSWSGPVDLAEIPTEILTYARDIEARDKAEVLANAVIAELSDLADQLTFNFEKHGHQPGAAPFAEAYIDTPDGEIGIRFGINDLGPDGESLRDFDWYVDTLAPDGGAISWVAIPPLDATPARIAGFVRAYHAMLTTNATTI